MKTKYQTLKRSRQVEEGLVRRRGPVRSACRMASTVGAGGRGMLV